MEKPGPEIQLAHCGAQRPTAQKTAKPQANGSGASYSRFTIHYLLLQLIGSDRSAFAASRHKVPGNQKLKNRVNVRFMTKVFWSILSKIRNPLTPARNPLDALESKQRGGISQLAVRRLIILTLNS
jgi:hypothetical protein